MAKKRKRRRASLITKAINAGILLLAFATPIEMLTRGVAIQTIANEATGGILQGGFDKDRAIRFYGPMVAAILLKKAISMVRRHARI